MSATITYRQLSSTGDPLWGQGQANFISDLQATAQAILTRLKLFEGEWWAATNDGLPLWQNILGQSGSLKSQQQISTLISARILSTPFVVGISNLQTNFSGRSYSYTATVVTQFGQVTITNIPQPPSGALS